jgi:hypothetical protein
VESAFLKVLKILLLSTMFKINQHEFGNSELRGPRRTPDPQSLMVGANQYLPYNYLLPRKMEYCLASNVVFGLDQQLSPSHWLYSTVPHLELTSIELEAWMRSP